MQLLNKNGMSAKRIIFVTGTDTGVGKTLLTALLLHHLRQTSPGRTLAMKPFCSGNRADVRLLQSLQSGELTDAEMNPFYFPQPIAPWVAAGKNRKFLRLDDVIQRIKEVQTKCDQLLIEGSGGLLVPLGEGFSVADLIGKLNCQVVVVARNQLGTINHTLLTVKVLQTIGIAAKNITIVLMSGPKTDISTRTNQRAIAALLRPKIGVLGISFLGSRANSTQMILKNHPKAKKTLKKIVCGSEV